MQNFKYLVIIKKGLCVLPAFCMVLLAGFMNFAVAETEQQARDPFVSPKFKRQKMQAIETQKTQDANNIIYVLTGIHLGRHKIAIINSQVVQVGDVIGESRIIDIRQNEVILERGKEQFIIRLEN